MARAAKGWSAGAAGHWAVAVEQRARERKRDGLRIAAAAQEMEEVEEIRV